MVYLGDDIRSKFNHQLNFDFGSTVTRKALHRGFYQKHHSLNQKHSIYK